MLIEALPISYEEKNWERSERLRLEANGNILEKKFLAYLHLVSGQFPSRRREKIIAYSQQTE